MLTDGRDLEIKGMSMDETTQGKCNVIEIEKEHKKTSGKHKNLRGG